MDLQETGVLKYQDPFVVIESNRARFETKIAKGAGSDPEWKEAFEFQVSSGMASSPAKLHCRPASLRLHGWPASKEVVDSPGKALIGN